MDSEAYAEAMEQAARACEIEWIRYLRNEGMSVEDISGVLCIPLADVQHVVAVLNRPEKPIAPEPHRG